MTTAVYVDIARKKRHVVTIIGRGHDFYGAYREVSYVDASTERVHPSVLYRPRRLAPGLYTLGHHEAARLTKSEGGGWVVRGQAGAAVFSSPAHFGKLTEALGALMNAFAEHG